MAESLAVDQEEIVELVTQRKSYFEMQTAPFKKGYIIPESEYVSPEILTNYEMANLIAKRIADIANGGKTTLTEDELYIDPNEVNKLTNTDIYEKSKIDGDNRLRICASVDIAKTEINLNKCPLYILRPLMDNGNEVWYQILDPNTAEKQVA